MRRSLLQSLLLGFSIVSFAQSPGGVSTSLRWWLKANEGVFIDNGTTPAADGNLVQQWNDQSAIVNHAQQTTTGNKPTYKTNIINGNPVLRYAGDQFVDGLAAPGIAATNSFTFFIVMKQSSYTAGGTADGAGTYIIDRTGTTNNLTSFKIANTDKYFLQKRNDDNSGIGGPVSITSATTSDFSIIDFYRDRTNSAYGIIINGRSDATSADDLANLTAPTIRLGRHTNTANGGIIGDIAEVIVYNTFPSTTERQRIESYLAVKYGITLNQTVAKDYIASDGTTIIYPASTTHASYNNDIAGIGVDNGSSLSQSASQSQNTNSLVRISSPSNITNGEFMLWGHNSPAISNSNNTPGGYANRISRVWKLSETGDVGSYNISFDLTGLGVDMTDATKFALLIDGDGNFSDATAHTTGRSVVGSVVSFTGVTTINNDYFSLATALIPGPGGVAGVVAWLRADMNAYVNAGTTLATNGQAVQQWNSQSQAAYNVSQATSGNRPTFVTDAANFNAVLRFTSSGSTHNFLDFGPMGISSSSDLNFFVAVKPTSITGGSLTDGAGGNIIERNSTTSSTNPLLDFKLLTTNRFGFQKRNNAGGGLGGVSTTTSISTATMQLLNYYRDYSVQYGILYNGAQEATLADADGALTVPNLRIGAHYDGNAGLTGDFGEFIFYNRDLSANEKSRIHSYLALKYGITLSQSTLTDYLSSAGTVIYPTTGSHSTYKFDIAGIGKDLTSTLTQSSSQSANTGSMVLVSSPSSLDDLDFLMWGSDNGSVTTPNSADVGAPILVRLARVWKIAETGETGTVTVSVDLTNVPGSKTQAHLRLMIDRDGDGFADNDVAPLTGTLASNIFTVTSVNFQNNDRFTIGSVSMGTPLPVELLYFNAKAKNNFVETSWATATELNSDYFIIQRSLDGAEFEDLEKVRAAGSSTVQRNYIFNDIKPYAGKSYYRLKQVDFDGVTSFSEVRVVNMDNPEFEIRVSPNPASGDAVQLIINGIKDQEIEILIFDTKGEQVLRSQQEVNTSKGGVHVAFKKPLSSGLYIVKVKSREGVMVTKFIVTH